VFSALTLLDLLGDMKGIWPIKTCESFPQRFCSRTIGERKPMVNQMTLVHLEDSVKTETGVICVCILQLACYAWRIELMSVFLQALLWSYHEVIKQLVTAVVFFCCATLYCYCVNNNDVSVDVILTL